MTKADPATTAVVARIDLWRLPDGSIEPRIRQMESPPTDGSECKVEIAGRFRMAAEWMREAAGRLEEEAGKLKRSI